MSLVDDQITNDTYNALDELGRRVNKSRNVLDAIQKVVDFESDMQKFKGPQSKEEENVVPEKNPINSAALAQEIQADMSR